MPKPFFSAWQRLTGKQPANSIDRVAPRFLQAFNEHGVETAQIPRLLPEIRLDDLQSPSKLLAALTPAILDRVAKLFGIRSEWLEGVDDRIYNYLAVYKHPAVLLEHLARIWPAQEDGIGFPLRVLTTTRSLDRHDDQYQQLAPVIVEQIAVLGDEEIYRFHIYQDGFDWGHLPARIELKAIARVVFKALHMPVPLFAVSQDDMDEITEGRMIPMRLLDGCLLTHPSLEDYALDPKESGIAKETDELPAVLEYIKEHRLDEISFDRPPPETSATVSAPENAETVSTDQFITPPKPGKRIDQRHDWAVLRAAAAALWAQGDQITYADMIRRLKKMPQLRATALSDSTIHKHIRDLAPPNIRGKSGRKPKKST